MENFAISSCSLGPIGTNCIIVANKTTKEILVFDAPIDVGLFLKEFFDSGYRIAGLFFTHGHFDHILGIGELPSGITTYAHEGDKKLYTRPQIMSSWMSPQEASALRPVPITHWLSANTQLQVAGLNISTIHTPGHSPGSVVFYLPQLHAAISGDCIFQGSIGRTDLPGGSLDELMASITKNILTLPDNTALYCGHGSATTVGHEKQSNDFIIFDKNPC